MKTSALTEAQKQATVRKWAEWILRQRSVAAKPAPKALTGSEALRPEKQSREAADVDF